MRAQSPIVTDRPIVHNPLLGTVFFSLFYAYLYLPQRYPQTDDRHLAFCQSAERSASGMRAPPHSCACSSGESAVLPRRAAPTKHAASVAKRAILKLAPSVAPLSRAYRGRFPQRQSHLRIGDRNIKKRCQLCFSLHSFRYKVSFFQRYLNL